MGWLTKFYSKIIKFPFVLRFEMRHEGKKIFHIVRHMRFLIYDKIPEEIIKEHRVTKALNDQKKLANDAKNVVKAEVKLAFNEQVEETLALKAITEIEEKLIQHEKTHGPTGYEKDFGKKVEGIIGQAHGEDRNVYFKYLEPIIKVAERKGKDNLTLMAEIRSLGDNSNMLSAIALRLEIRTASKELKKLKHEPKVIADALKQWDDVKGNKTQAARRLKDALFEIEYSIQRDLHHSTLIAKRDFLLTILTLKYINDNEEFMKGYYLKQVMPQLPEEERIESFEKLKKNLCDHARMLAQGMRRILDAEERNGKLAREIQSLANK